MTNHLDEDGLAFFNRLSGHLEIKLSEPPVRIAENLLNVKAPSTAKIEEISLELRVFEKGNSRGLTEDELNRVVLHEKSIKMRGEEGDDVEHEAPNGKHFTVRDLANAVAKTERMTRDKTEWFGGIDVHHVYFEGIHLEEDGVWSIAWGS